MTSAQHQQQQQVDPAYLRQYYAQQQAGAQGAQRETPIYEAQEQPQYDQQGGPLKNVSCNISPLFHAVPRFKGWKERNY